jgi:DivIVA domain-containing protein
MTITPQAIRDQDFQTRFRGYDAIEVKGYLELVAEEFFELLEKIRHQEEIIQGRDQETEQDETDRNRLEEQLQDARQEILRMGEELAQRDEDKQHLDEELAGLRREIDAFDTERQSHAAALATAEQQKKEVEQQLRKTEIMVEEMRTKITLMKEHNEELRREEVDFKRTIGAAQRFADELRQTAERESMELLRQSEEKARAALASAYREVQQLRQRAYTEFSRLPAEIERLNEQRRTLRDELHQLLGKHTSMLDEFSEINQEITHISYDELFEKINVADDGDELDESLDTPDPSDVGLPIMEDTDNGDGGDDFPGEPAANSVAYFSDEKKT